MVRVNSFRWKSVRNLTRAHLEVSLTFKIFSYNRHFYYIVCLNKQPHIASITGILWDTDLLFDRKFSRRKFLLRQTKEL